MAGVGPHALQSPKGTLALPLARGIIHRMLGGTGFGGRLTKQKAASPRRETASLMPENNPLP